MIWSDIPRGAVLAAIAVAHVAGFLSVPLLAVVAFLVGALSVVFDTGSFAYVPNMIEEADLPAANRAVQGSTGMALSTIPMLARRIRGLAAPEDARDTEPPARAPEPAPERVG
jgi:hypothetical protein